VTALGAVIGSRTPVSVTGLLFAAEKTRKTNPTTSDRNKYNFMAHPSLSWSCHARAGALRVRPVFPLPHGSCCRYWLSLRQVGESACSRALTTHRHCGRTRTKPP